MKLPLSWLREWVDLPDDVQAIATQLTSLGFEVEALERVAPPFNAVVVAEIQAIAPHPQADKLRVCTVNAGTGSAPLQIVCGAPNARAGLKTALAQPGAVLPGDLKIKAAKLRGRGGAGSTTLIWTHCASGLGSGPCWGGIDIWRSGPNCRIGGIRSAADTAHHTLPALAFSPTFSKRPGRPAKGGWFFLDNPLGGWENTTTRSERTRGEPSRHGGGP